MRLIVNKVYMSAFIGIVLVVGIFLFLTYSVIAFFVGGTVAIWLIILFIIGIVLLASTA